jgi:hypothetical protein
MGFHPSRSLTGALEQAAVNETSIAHHNTPSYVSTNSNSRTRLDTDELDDELHRVARLDRNLDIVRQQVRTTLLNKVAPVAPVHVCSRTINLFFRFKSYILRRPRNMMNRPAHLYPGSQAFSMSTFTKMNLRPMKPYIQNFHHAQS